MRVIIRKDAPEASVYVASYIIERIKAFRPTPSKPFVLGLPTGSSPELVYKHLVQAYKNGEISFQNVITFNMDEYVNLPPTHPESYHSFMYKHFFSHIDINPSNVHILDGNAPDLARECVMYEEKIRRCGGIELFLGGIGSDGHIAFNEPGSSLNSRTRVKTLAYETVVANSRFFDDDVEKVPKMALTVGVATVLDAREVVIIVTGNHKAAALQQSLEQGVSAMCPFSALQLHERALIVADDPATIELKVKTVNYYKSIEMIANQNGFTQTIRPQVEIDNTSKSVKEELDSPVPSVAKEGLLAKPENVDLQHMRSPTPELMPDRMASRLANGYGNGLDTGEVQFQNMSSRVAPLAG
ncbi:glucosamine-6-phosphate isomerase [Tothia fuscella]|uniref:Glucosamine-6-phosphate isomerase n=1 Tax=Tothia fuscella TaxID=1048955 RepID=A0A9P4NNL3_9PEZI|nr:glucosamine-6-phosphate isomerase [Tothia fuscella]